MMHGWYADTVFVEEDKRLRDSAEQLVARCPPKLDDDWVRCHELARAVAMHLGDLRVVDGTLGAVQHSWIVTPNKKILDVYAPGRIPQVQLVDPYAPIQVGGYKSGALRDDIREGAVTRLHEAMRSLLDVWVANHEWPPREEWKRWERGK